MRDRPERTARRLAPGLEAMDERVLLAVLGPIDDVTIPQFMSLPIVLDADDATDQAYAATSTDPDIQVEVIRGRFLEIVVNHEPSGPTDVDIDNETITFQLFDELTPLTIQRIEELVDSDFYTGKNFHRITSGFPGPMDFIVQGGSVNGSGGGEVPLPGFPFEDEFVPGLGFTGDNQLAMANAGRDTNGSQFFATHRQAGSTSTQGPRFLDYIHTIFAQLVDGEETLDKMTRVTRNGETPVNPVTIVSAEIVDTGPNGVLLVDATEAEIGDTATISVTATDADGSVTETFEAEVEANLNGVNGAGEPVNERPFFTIVPENVTVSEDQVAVFQAQFYNAEVNDRLTFQVHGGRTGNTSNPTFTPVENATATIDSNGIVRVTPEEGFTGTIDILVAVRDQVDRTAGNGNFDTKQLTITVTDDAEPVNLPPIAAPVNATTSVGSPVQIQLRGEAANEGQGLTFSVVQQPANGTVSSLSANGAITYTPRPGFVGTDTFRYQVRDTGDPTPNLTSESALVTITVTAATSAVRIIPPVRANDPEDLQRVLVVTPPPQADLHARNRIEVFKDGDDLAVRINGVEDQTRIAEEDVTRVVVYGSRASDSIVVAPDVDVPATLNGGQGGRNTVKAGNVGSLLHGWFGVNTLQGGDAKDLLIGRAGQAKLLPSGGDDVGFLGRPRPGSQPGGQFFRLKNGKFVPIPTPPPKVIGSRAENTIGDFSIPGGR